MTSIWVFPMKAKKGVLTNIKTIHDAYKAKNRAVHVICNDNETLYRGNEMKKFERALRIKQVPFAEYVKNGNRAEPANRIIEQKIMANLLDGMGSPSMWDTCTGLSMAQANRTVKLNSSNPLLHHLTPHQVWNLPNHILKQASDQLRNNEVDIESVLLLAPKNDLSQLRVFLSPAQVYDHTTLRGRLPTNGMAKEGTWVYIGPADDDKGALKLLNLKSLKTTETASAIIQDDFARSRIDELTEYDRVGAIGTSHPSGCSSMSTCTWLFSTMTMVVRNPHWGVTHPRLYYEKSTAGRGYHWDYYDSEIA